MPSRQALQCTNREIPVPRRMHGLKTAATSLSGENHLKGVSKLGIAE
jgi:hypothetical protein